MFWPVFLARQWPKFPYGDVILARAKKVGPKCRCTLLWHAVWENLKEKIFYFFFLKRWWRHLVNKVVLINVVRIPT